MARYWRNYYDPYGGYSNYDNYWWGAPYGWSDYDLYDYNNNCMLDDNEIEDIVRDNIADDPGISYSDQEKIEVKVDNGVVTLSGEVRNPRSKPLAYSDAYWSSGVMDVNNKITVKQRQMKGQEEEEETSKNKEMG
jgi:hypothetical protein